MGGILILIGVLVLIFLSVFWGFVLIVLGLFLWFAPVPHSYGNSYWRDRRRRPPP